MRGKSVNFEIDVLPGLNRSYIALIRGDIDLHLREVLRDGEQRRRLQRRRDRLANVYAARNDRAIDRRANDGVVQVGLGHGDGRRLLLYLRGRLRHLRLGGADRSVIGLPGSLGRVELLGWNHACLSQRGGAIVINFGLCRGRLGLREVGFGRNEVRLPVGQIGLRLEQRALEQRGVDLRHHLVLLHMRVKIGKQRLDRPRYL